MLFVGSEAECSEFARRYIAQMIKRIAQLLRQRAAMSEISHTRKNSARRRLTARGSFFKIDDGGSRKGSKGNAVRVLGGTLYRGCPRNCERRAFGRHDHWDGKILGRWPKAATREPGHLPPATSHARARWAGCPGVNVRVRSLRGCCPGRMAERATAKIAVTGFGFAVGAWRVACHQQRSHLRPCSRIALSPHLHLGSCCALGSRSRPRANGATVGASRAKSGHAASGPHRSASQ